MKLGMVFAAALLAGAGFAQEPRTNAHTTIFPASRTNAQAALSPSTKVVPTVSVLMALPVKTANLQPHIGEASWYGEDHRGRLMANGQRFDPDKLTAASWFYPLGTRVRVTLKTPANVLNPQPSRTVLVTITDRGPHRRLVRNGRIIDLSHGVFRRLADPDLGLIEVIVRPELTPGPIAMR